MSAPLPSPPLLPLFAANAKALLSLSLPPSLPLVLLLLRVTLTPSASNNSPEWTTNDDCDTERCDFSGEPGSETLF